MMVENKIGAVMVIGSGIGGIQASLDLADQGFKVYVIEKEPVIGGIMAQLDKTFPTNDCSMCILAPKMVEVGRNPNIDLYTYSEIEKITGTAGNFEVSVLKKARAIDESKCVACAICSQKCPIRVPAEYNKSLNQRTAIYIPFPQAVPSIYLIDKENCLFYQRGICKICEKFCDAQALDFDQKSETIKLKVGSIIIAIGAETFNASQLPQYGYEQFPNVITSIEFERILNASGPFSGHVIRPSDQTIPKKILWLNCVGSRNSKIGNDYCSSVCCMYSIKEAVITKEHDPNVECYIFFIDIRAVGKGFDEYYVRARDSGINFIKARISSLEENPINQNILVAYENIETGELIENEFELVVLSVGLQPSDSAANFCKELGIDLNEYRFCLTNPFTPLETSKPGIYVCGTLSGPKDIPETVAEASGAVGEAASLLHTERYKLITEKEYPPEINVEGQEPRIGVFVCHCGINIGSVVNVPGVVEFVKTLPNVVYAEENLYTCSQDTQEKIKQTIKEHNLNRIVVASCTPRTHEPLFQNTIREAGLNPYLFDLANIREQCSWVHMTEPEVATEKAKDLVAMSIVKIGNSQPVYETSVDVTRAALVIGGGIAGMSAALELANQEFEVFLVEKEEEIGGLVRNIRYVLGDEDPQKYLKALINDVKNNKKIKVFINTEIEDIGGFVGNFTIKIKHENEEKELHSGAIIVATGGTEYKPTEYMYGKSDKIVTQQELEQKLVKNEIDAKNVVMIQCVGSRNEKRPYCSRICCSVAIKNALKLKTLNPDTDITILYRDIRTYGYQEEYYRKARENGITFVRFLENNEPEVNINNNEIVISVTDSLTGTKLEKRPDLVVLSSAFLPTENKDLSQMLKVPLEQNGFFLEAHVKLRPLDFATDGIFLCGAAQWPKFINESIAQAKGAAARAATILSKDKIKIAGATAIIDEDKCIGCGQCREVCVFNAIEMVEVKKEFENARMGSNPVLEITRYKSKVNPAVCKGCGVCVNVCPVGALTAINFTKKQFTDMFRFYLKEMGVVE